MFKKNLLPIFTNLIALSACSISASNKSLTSINSTESSNPSGSLITAPAQNGIIPSSNLSNYRISGTCPAGAATITFSDDINGTANCSDGLWTSDLNLNSHPDGLISITVTADSGATASINVTKDTQGPTLLGSVSDSTALNSLTNSPNLSWNIATDSGSGLDHYEIAVGTVAPGATNTFDWTSIGDLTTYQIVGLSLTDGTVYYASVRAIDKAGNFSTPINSDGWTADVTRPTTTLASVSTDTAQRQSFTLSFSESVSDFTAEDISVVNGFVDNFAGSGADYTFDVIAQDPGTLSASVATDKATDSAGNTNLASAVISSTFVAVSGSIDIAFGTNGSVGVSNAFDIGASIEQPDGKVLGIAESGSKLVRFTSAGALDTTFGSGGIADFSGTFGSATDKTRSLGLQSVGINSGKIIIAGVYSEVKKIFIARVNTNGTLDTSFGTSGSTIIQPLAAGTNCNYPLFYKVHSDDSIFVAVDCTDGGSSAVIVKLNANGNLDTTFNNTGIVLSTHESPPYLAGLAVTTAGKPLIQITGGTKLELRQFTTAGVLDTSFNGTGSHLISDANLSSSSSLAHGLIILSSGKILVSTLYKPSSFKYLTLWRFTSTGYIDDTFGTVGKYITIHPFVLDNGSSLLETSTDTVLVHRSLDNTGKVTSYSLGSPAAANPAFGVDGVAYVGYTNASTTYINSYKSDRVLMPLRESSGLYHRIMRVWK